MIQDQLSTFLDEKAKYLEMHRKKAVFLNYLFTLVRIVRPMVAIVFAILLIINFVFPLLIFVLLITGAATVILYLINDPKAVFKSKLKNHVLPEIFRYVNETYTYMADGFNQDTLQQSGFLTESYFNKTIKLRGEDHVKGSIENVEVEFFEIEFYREELNYLKTAGGCLAAILLLPVLLIGLLRGGGGSVELSYGGAVYDEKNFYAGLFMYADFHKDFKGKVLMIPKENSQMMDKIADALLGTTLSKINVENPFINERYNIYTSVPQLGYYVLSQSLIDKIHGMAEAEQALPILSFIDGKMYFMIPWARDMFQVDVSSEIKDGSHFLPYLQEVSFFEEIVKELNLHTRIWTKA